MDSPTGELAAAIYALTKFRSYLGYTFFQLITDSTTVRSLLTSEKLCGKMARWAILLSEFNFEIIHKAGTSIGNVDGLSRCAQDPDPDGHQEMMQQIWNADVDDDASKADDVSTTDDVDIDDEGTIFEVWEVGCDVHIETSIAECNNLRINLQDSKCEQCGGTVEGRSGVTCGWCGRVEHRSCSKPRAKHTYWFCTNCEEKLGPAEHREDLATRTDI